MKFLIGSRKSALALAQANNVQGELSKLFRSHLFGIKKIVTVGDVDQSLSIFKKVPQGVFTKEIERYLLKEDIDIAVHSLKDLPTTITAGLKIGAYTKRENPWDVIWAKRGVGIRELRTGATVGTSSVRRRIQLLSVRKDLKVKNIRGNVDSRLRRVREKKLDAVVLAEAGLRRLGLGGSSLRRFKSKKILPAAGQGVLAIQVRVKDKRIQKMVSHLDHLPTRISAIAERECLKWLHGGCQVPVGILGRVTRGQLKIGASVYSVYNEPILYAETAGSPKQAVQLGKALAKKLLSKGAKRYLDEARER